ncbi:MAG: cell division protein ZapA [Magnetococcales bacterium]|nr:cell division protein ZapA [Magnetococcales bacterium]
MSETIEVNICGRLLRLKASTSKEKEYLQEVAGYVDSVMKELIQQGGSSAHDRLALMAAMRIADTLFKQRQRAIEGINSVEMELDRLVNISE